MPELEEQTLTYSQCLKLKHLKDEQAVTELYIRNACHKKGPRFNADLTINDTTKEGDHFEIFLPRGCWVNVLDQVALGTFIDCAAVRKYVTQGLVLVRPTDLPLSDGEIARGSNKVNEFRKRFNSDVYTENTAVRNFDHDSLEKKSEAENKIAKLTSGEGEGSTDAKDLIAALKDKNQQDAASKVNPELEMIFLELKNKTVKHIDAVERLRDLEDSFVDKDITYLKAQSANYPAIRKYVEEAFN